MQNSPLPGSFYLDPQRFDSTISNIGVNILWRVGHVCPCGAMNGTPEPACLTCGGFGRYWDATGAQFVGLITMSIPDDPSARIDEDKGIIQNALPVLTIPSTAASPWASASVFDQFVVMDAIQRFSESLVVGKREILAYSYGATVPASGAVNRYDYTNKVIVPDNSYTVTVSSGLTLVHITDQPEGTLFNVDYTARQSYIAIGRGGAPHVRPELAGGTFPRRLQLNPSDVYLRGQSTTGTYG